MINLILSNCGWLTYHNWSLAGSRCFLEDLFWFIISGVWMTRSGTNSTAHVTSIPSANFSRKWWSWRSIRVWKRSILIIINLYLTQCRYDIQIRLNNYIKKTILFAWQCNQHTICKKYVYTISFQNRAFGKLPIIVKRRMMQFCIHNWC